MYMLRNRMDADDITQEVLIKIWNNINKFNILAAKTWIMKTTHNLCIDFIRKRKSEMQKTPYSVDEINNIENLEEASPDLMMENQITGEKIKNAIKQLPEVQRSVFVLYEIQGMKYKEISKTLEIPINTVKVYLMRSRKQLQIYLSETKLQEVI